jgi:hypothetical protein
LRLWNNLAKKIWQPWGDLSRPIMMKYYCESHYTQWKHNRNRKCTSVQKSEHYKTLMLMLLGEITFVTGPDCIFVNLWGACDSSVLQCIETKSS